MITSKCLARVHHLFKECNTFIYNDNNTDDNDTQYHPLPNDYTQRIVQCLYKHDNLELHTLSTQLRHRLQQRLLSMSHQLSFPLSFPHIRSAQSIRAFLHQQFDHTTHHVPQLFHPPLARDTPTSYKLRVDLQGTTTAPKTVRIHVPSLHEHHIRYTLANTLHQPADGFEVHIHEKERWVQCTLLPSATRIPLNLVFLNKDGAVLWRTSLSLHTTSPLSTTLFAIVHHPRVRRWLYVFDQHHQYTHITPFLHTQVFTQYSLDYHSHLQPNDTLYCIMTTQQQQQEMHHCIEQWVNLLCAQRATAGTALYYIHTLRQQLYKEEHTTIPHTEAFRLTAFHEHLWLQWIWQLSFLYTIHRLRKHKTMHRWLSLHCTLLVNSIWNDYAYHTNRVFDHCARQSVVQETSHWKYTMDHWDVFCLGMRPTPTKHNKHYLVHNMRQEYTQKMHKTINTPL